MLNVILRLCSATVLSVKLRFNSVTASSHSLPRAAHTSHPSPSFDKLRINARPRIIFFQHLQRMPLASLDLHHGYFDRLSNRTRRSHHKLICDIAIIIIEPHNHLPPDHTNGLGGLHVPVDRHHCSWLKSTDFRLPLSYFDFAQHRLQVGKDYMRTNISALAAPSVEHSFTIILGRISQVIRLPQPR